MSTVKTQFAISEEALTVINRNASERKRGEWLSRAVIEYDRLISGAVPVVTDDGVLERIESRLSHLEQQVGMLIRLAAQPGGQSEDGDDHSD